MKEYTPESNISTKGPEKNNWVQNATKLLSQIFIKKL